MQQSAHHLGAAQWNGYYLFAKLREMGTIFGSHRFIGKRQQGDTMFRSQQPKLVVGTDLIALKRRIGEACRDKKNFHAGYGNREEAGSRFYTIT